jgi:hypothetical protein
MENSFWRIGKKILGVILIIGGIIGCFLPFFQGIAMIIAGAVLLENKWVIDKVHKTIEYFKNLKKR